MTQEFLQDAIVEDLKQLFSHYTRRASPFVRVTTKKPTRKRRRSLMWP